MYQRGAATDRFQIGERMLLLAQCKVDTGGKVACVERLRDEVERTMYGGEMANDGRVSVCRNRTMAMKYMVQADRRSSRQGYAGQGGNSEQALSITRV